METAKERILKLLIENMKNFKENSWNLQNRMNKLIIDKDKKTVFTLRLGGKKIIRYSLDLLDDIQKLNFLADFYTSVANNEFDDDIVNFLAKEVEKATERKKEANERRKLKKKEEKECKAKEVRERTLAAAQPILDEQIAQVLQIL